MLHPVLTTDPYAQKLVSVSAMGANAYKDNTRNDKSS